MNQVLKNEIDLIDYIKIMYKSRYLILIFVIVVMVFVGIRSLNQPKVYEATTTFFPIEHQAVENSAFMGTQTRVDELIVAVLQSRRMADMVVRQLNLRKHFDTNSIEIASRALRQRIGVDLGKSNVIELSVRDGSAQLAVKIANTYVANLEHFNSELGFGARRQVVQVIDEAIMPEDRMPRETIKKTITAGMISFVGIVFIVFLINFSRESNIVERLKEK